MESAVIQIRCSLSGKPARVIFARDEGAWRFEFQGVKVGTSVSTTVGGTAKRLPAGRTADGPPIRIDVGGTEINASQVDWTGFVCPHCQETSKYAVIRCGNCKELVCGSSYLEEGDRSGFSCGSCGHESQGKRKMGSISSYKGTRSVSRAAPALPPAGGLLGAAKRLLPRGKPNRE